MILHCDFEELRALDRGAALVLEAHAGRSPFRIPASGEVLSQVEDLRPLLTGSIEVADLEEVQGIQSAVHLIARTLLEMMQTRILELHPAHEEAVGLYFDYAHVLVVENRVNHMAAEMHALADLISPESIIG
jgi:hypothetical protein